VNETVYHVCVIRKVYIYTISKLHNLYNIEIKFEIIITVYFEEVYTVKPGSS
jgi:hypothetical protein